MANSADDLRRWRELNEALESEIRKSESESDEGAESGGTPTREGKCMKIDQVLEAIKRERAYQDAKWGTPEQNPHRVSKWLHLIRTELYKAEAALEFGDKRDALCEILHLVSVGVACLEQHGVVEREEVSS